MVHVKFVEVLGAVGEIGIRKVGFSVSLPGNGRTVTHQLGDQMLGRGLTAGTGKDVSSDTKICPCFEPQVIRQTGVVPRRVEILLRVRPQRYQAVDIRGQRTAFDIWVTR